MGDVALMVPAKGLIVVGSFGVLGGFFAGFSLAERLYATDAQKNSVRTLGTLAVATVALTAAAGAIGVMRARA